MEVYNLVMYIHAGTKRFEYEVAIPNSLMGYSLCVFAHVSESEDKVDTIVGHWKKRCSTTQPGPSSQDLSLGVYSENWTPYNEITGIQPRTTARKHVRGS